MVRKSIRSAVFMMAGAFALAALTGCQVWNNTLDLLKVPVPEKPTQTSKFVPPSRVEDVAIDAGPREAPLIPRVTVYRISAPVGTFTSNDKVWSELNEDALDSKTSVLLAQNGLRAGVGMIARWPSIQRLVDVPGASSDQFNCQTDGRSSVNVVTRPGITDEIVVSIDRDLQQQGRTFERCDNGFRLSMHGIRGKHELVVQLEPIVTLGTVAVSHTVGELGTGKQGFTSEEAFNDLLMSAHLNSDQFLILSPVDPKESRFSVGSLWLSDVEKAPPTETVLIFVPAAK